MKIERIELHHISQKLVHPFRTSVGTQLERPCILVSVHGEGLTGWGECVASTDPEYTYETISTAWHILKDFIIPNTVGQEIVGLGDTKAYFKGVRGHPLAKAALENSLWDIFAKAKEVPLSRLLNRDSDHATRVEVGVSIGIQPTLSELLNRVGNFVNQGYQRIKIKIEPGWEIEPLTAIRERHPDIKLMADANSAFSLDDVPLFQEMDNLNLLMIEQPLHYDDIYEHSKLQKQIKTPVCLDESIHLPTHAKAAIELGSCRIINMKVGRVGGLNNAKSIHDMCLKASIPIWCGGMLETGIGRATNLHLATMPNFTLPGDISATSRYYHEDIAEPAFELNREDSTISVPMGLGIGVEVRLDRVKKHRIRHEIFTI
ncbi:o-succinylbenzoate synthase [Anaerolineales bacterium HSG25]|nr:o-succinylbenzoate synthase [Anaerolineales bacterium HSG25]